MKEIVKRLMESKHLPDGVSMDRDTIRLSETVVVGGNWYWKSRGKCWTQPTDKSAPRQEIPEEDYRKMCAQAKNGVSDMPDKSKKSDSSDPSSDKIGTERKLGDWSYTKIGDDSWETTYKGKKQDTRTDADIKRVFSGSDKPKKSVDNPISSNQDILSSINNMKYDDISDDGLDISVGDYSLSAQKYGDHVNIEVFDKNDNPVARWGDIQSQADLDYAKKKLISNVYNHTTKTPKKKDPVDAKYDAGKMEHFANVAIDDHATDPETTVTLSGSTVMVDLGNADMNNEKLIKKLKDLGLKQTADWRFVGYNH